MVVSVNRVSTVHDKNDINNLLLIQKRAIWAKFRELIVMTVVHIIAYNTVLFNKNIESIHHQNIHNFYNMMGRGFYSTVQYLNWQSNDRSSKIEVFFIEINVRNKLPGRATVQNLPKIISNFKKIFVDKSAYTFT